MARRIQRAEPKPKPRRRKTKCVGGPCHKQVLNIFIDDLDEIITFIGEEGSYRYDHARQEYHYVEPR